MGEVHRVEIQPTITGPDAPPVKGERPPSSPQGQPHDKQPKGTPPPQPRPEWMPEKFWRNGNPDYEGLAKSYSELEKKQGGQAPLSVEKKQDQTNGEQTPKADGGDKAGEAPQQKQPEDVPTIPGVKQEQVSQFWTELTSEGKLSEKSYADLEKAGYPKSVVDVYIKGIQAEQNEAKTQVSEYQALAGGADGYSAMAEWMSANLEAEELAEYNEAVTSGKPAIIRLAIKNMHARFKGAMGGSEPKLLGGRGTEPPRGDVFRSQSEVTQAMRDPRYKKDPAYRREVEDKLRRSSI